MAMFTETAFLESSATIDAENGVIRHAKLRGMESKNNRRYTREATDKSVALYDGSKVYVNHPRRSDSGEDRSFESLAGVVQNPKAESGGIYGDVHLLKESPHYRQIVEAAQRFPKSIGFSHVADGDSRMEGSTEVIESINSVLSVDLVTDPATTNGIFESVRRNGKKVTLRQVAESLPESNVFRSRLIEGMDAGMFDGGATVDSQSGDDDGDVLSLISSVFQKALETVAAIVGSKEMANAATGQAAAAAATPQVHVVNAGAGVGAAAGNPAAAHGANGAANDPTKTQYESRISTLEKRLALADAKNLLTESGIDPTEIRVSTLASTPEAHRKALVESWPKKDAPNLTESGSGGFWPESSPPANRGGSGSNEPTADPKYAERFTEASKRSADRIRGTVAK
jgi:hypothetical protein